MCDLQHHFGKGFGTPNERRTFFAHSGQRDTSEQCEHQNLQNVVRRHRFERIFRENRQYEFPEVEFLDLANRGCGIGDAIDRRANAWLEQVDHQQSKANRDEAGDDKPCDCPETDSAQRTAVTHMGNADDDGRQDQRRDQKLDEIKENIGKQFERLGDIFELRTVLRETDMDGVTHGYAEDHPHQNPQSKPFVHAKPPIFLTFVHATQE